MRVASKSNSKAQFEVRGYLAKLRLGGIESLRAAARLRNKEASPWILKNFKEFYQNESFKNLCMPDPFPSSIALLNASTFPLSMQSPFDECFWATGICLQHKEKLRDFLDLKSSFEAATLRGEISECKLLLEEIKNSFGYSYWYLSSRLMLEQAELGLDAQKKLSQEYLSELNHSQIPYFALYFTSKRCNGSSVRNGLNSEITNVLASIDDEELRAYLESRLIERPNIATADTASIFKYEYRSSLIDLYEFLICSLQSVLANSNLRSELIGGLKIPVNLLHRSTQDIRTIPLLRILGDPTAPTATEINEHRLKAFEDFSKENYEDAYEHCRRSLEANPNDIFVIKTASQSLAMLTCNGDAASIKSSLSRPLEFLIENLAIIYSASDNSYLSAYNILNLTSQFYGHSWAYQANTLVMSILTPATIESTNYQYSKLISLSPSSAPDSYYIFREPARRKFLSDLLQTTKLTSTCALIRHLVDGTNLISEEETPYRVAHTKLRRQLSSLNFKNAKKECEWIILNKSNFAKVEAMATLCLIQLKEKRLEDATKTAVESVLYNEIACSKLPFAELMTNIESPDTWTNSIYFPIFFEMYNSKISDKNKTVLRYSFELYQINNKIPSPSDIISLRPDIPKDLIVYYLNNVCSPDTMRHTMLYEGSQEVEEERIKICQSLAEYDPDNFDIYIREVEDRVKNLEINKAASLIEKSKVYVDIGTISKTLKLRLNDSYSRYKSVFSSPQEESREVIDSLIALAKKLNPENPENAMEHFHLVGRPVTEGDSAFDAMYREVVNEFLTGEYGLNVFLSTQIRHGALNNILRKPVGDEKLVTSFTDDGVRYLPNTHWASRFSTLDKRSTDILLKALDTFNATYDEIIRHIKNDLLQISSFSTYESERSNPAALFLYLSSNFERKILQKAIAGKMNVDHFIELCIDLLWKKTDTNLTEVRRVLHTEIRNRFNIAFNELTATINSIQTESGCSMHSLTDAVARAKTGLQTSLDTVIRWFNRNEVYERQDYEIAFPVQIAVNMTRKTTPMLPKYFDIKIEKSGSDLFMPGRTLDGLVYVFYTMFVNAISYCKLNLEELELGVKIRVHEEKCTIIIENNLGEEAITPATLSRVDSIRARTTFNKDGVDLLQKEGGTGLYKVWKVFNSPLYLLPQVSFGFTDQKTFEVKIEFRTGDERGEATVN